MRTKRSFVVSLGAVVLLAALRVNAASLPDVESTVTSDGSWTAFSFPTQVPKNAKVKVTKATCEKPKMEDVEFVLVPKGKCEGPAGSLQPKGATHPDKLEGLRYKLSDNDLCAGSAATDMRCTIYADTEW